MSEHNFKKGDKVKLRKPKCWSMGDSVGEVVGFDPPFIRVTWKGKVYQEDYPHLVREIEYVMKVGEQLTFGFM